MYDEILIYVNWYFTKNKFSCPILKVQRGQKKKIKKNKEFIYSEISRWKLF